MHSYTLTRRLIEPKNLLPVVMKAAGGGMMVMMLMFMTPLAGFPLVIMIAFMGTIAIIIAIYIRSATYTIDATGIREELNQWQRVVKMGGPSNRFYTWAQVKSYKDDSDMSRGLRDIAFIKLWMNDGYQMKISQKTNEDTDPAFFVFRDRFRELIALHNGAPASSSSTTGTPPSAAPRYVTDPVTSTVKLDTSNEVIKNEPIAIIKEQSRHIIEKKKGFYKTLPGKAVTIFFFAITALLIYVVIILKGDLSGEVLAISSFRLLFVLIPGCIYLAYRSFYKAE